MTETVTIRMMGRPGRVTAGLTIMKAVEEAGHRYVRGAGCRAGFCGACATLYRLPGDARLRPALACQTQVEEGMDLVQLPSIPVGRTPFELESVRPGRPGTILPAAYPEVARCVACNTCTKICPQGLEVMDAIQLALRDDIAGVAREAFDCIQCGLCSLRCPADIPHHTLYQMARRIDARFGRTPSADLARRVAEIEAGRHAAGLDRLQAMTPTDLGEAYRTRTIEP